MLNHKAGLLEVGHPSVRAWGFLIIQPCLRLKQRRPGVPSVWHANNCCCVLSHRSTWETASFVGERNHNVPSSYGWMRLVHRSYKPLMLATGDLSSMCSTVCWLWVCASTSNVWIMMVRPISSLIATAMAKREIQLLAGVSIHRKNTFFFLRGLG